MTKPPECDIIKVQKKERENNTMTKLEKLINRIENNTASRYGLEARRTIRAFRFTAFLRLFVFHKYTGVKMTDTIDGKTVLVYHNGTAITD